MTLVIALWWSSAALSSTSITHNGYVTVVPVTHTLFSPSQLVGGPFDLKENFQIREPGVVPLLLELLPHLPQELQVCTSMFV